MLICALMFCNCTLSVCAEVLYDYDYTTATAPVQYDEPDKTFFEDSSEYENYSYKVRICTISTRTESSYVSVLQQYNTVYSASPIVFYVDENGCFCSYSEGEQSGNSVKVSFNNTLSADGYVRHYKSDISYVSYNSYVHNDYKSNTDIDVKIYYNSDYIFDSLDSAKAYLETGKVENVLYSPYSEELQEDVTQGFNQFQARRIKDSSIAGGTGVLVTYDIPVELLRADEEQYIVYELNYSYKLGYGGNGSLSKYRNLYESCEIVVIDKLTSCSGQRVFDFIELCESYNILNEYELSLVIKSMNEYCVENHVLYTWGTRILASGIFFLMMILKMVYRVL